MRVIWLKRFKNYSYLFILSLFVFLPIIIDPLFATSAHKEPQSIQHIESFSIESLDNLVDAGNPNLPVNNTTAHMTISLEPRICLTNQLSQLQIILYNPESVSHQFQLSIKVPTSFYILEIPDKTIIDLNQDTLTLYTLDSTNLNPEEEFVYIFQLNVTQALYDGIMAATFEVAASLLIDEDIVETCELSLLVTKSSHNIPVKNPRVILPELEYRLSPSVTNLTRPATFLLTIRNPTEIPMNYVAHLIDETFGELEFYNESTALMDRNESSGIIYPITPNEGLKLAPGHLFKYTIKIQPKEFIRPFTRYKIPFELIQENQIIHNTTLVVDAIGSAHNTISISNVRVQSDGDLLSIIFKLPSQIIEAAAVDPSIVIAYVRLEEYDNLIPCSLDGMQFVAKTPLEGLELPPLLNVEILTIYDPKQGLSEVSSLIYGTRTELIQIFGYSIQMKGYTEIPNELFITEGEVIQIDLNINFGQIPLSEVFVLAQIRNQRSGNDRVTFANDENIQGMEIEPGHYQIIVDTNGMQGGSYSIAISLYKSGYQRAAMLLVSFQLEPSLRSKFMRFASITIQVLIILGIIYGAMKIMLSGFSE